MKQQRETKPKVIVVGLDGATMELITPWVEAGKLPNLSRMMKDGVWAELRSTIPYITTTAWSSFATGINPGKHGIFDFYQHIRNTFDVYFTNSGVRRGKTLWRRVSEQGKKVCIINVPMTFPPEEVDGVMISGMDAPGTGARFTYPDNVYDELKEAIGEYVIDMHFDEIVRNGRPGLDDYKEYLGRLAKMVENRCQATEYLMEKYPWDLLATVFVATDRGQHQFWKFMDRSHPAYKREEAEQMGDAILQIYEKCDEALGRILNKIDENTTLLIMSDHGAGPGHRVFYVRTWLRKSGYLVLKDSARAGPGLRKDFVRTGKFLFAAAKKFTPARIKHQLKRRIGADRLIAMRLFFDVDWGKTRAYSEGVCGNIFINLKGREPHGIVEPGEEYESVCEDIIARLMQVKDPKTNTSVVKKIYRKEEIYSGPLAENAPDLTVEGYPEFHCRGDSFAKDTFAGASELFSDAPLSGTHRIEGAFLGIGPHLKRGYRLPQAAIIDLAPTMLYLLGLDIPETLDGRVLTEAFTEQYIRENPPKMTEEADEAGSAIDWDIYSSGEKEQIEDRLRGLGYLE